MRVDLVGRLVTWALRIQPLVLVEWSGIDAAWFEFAHVSIRTYTDAL